MTALFLLSVSIAPLGEVSLVPLVTPLDKRTCRGATKLGVHSDQEIRWGADLPDLDPQIRSFVGPRVWFVQQLAESQPHLL